MLDACITHEDMDFSKGLLGRSEQGLHLYLWAHIGTHRNGLDALASSLLTDLLRCVRGVYIIDNDVGAMGGEPKSNSSTDSTARACDDGAFVLEGLGHGRRHVRGKDQERKERIGPD